MSDAIGKQSDTSSKNMNASGESKSEYEVWVMNGKLLPEKYRGMVFSKWMRSYRFGNDYIKLTDPDSYFYAYNIYVGSVLARPLTQVRLAVLSDNHDVVLGFSVIEGTTLHYVHVHKDQRKQGIAKNLIPVRIEQFTHLTKIGLKLWATEMADVKFNPFA